MSSFVLTSCSDDPKVEPNNPNLTGEELSEKSAMFVGTWFNAQSYGGIFYTFQADGKCFTTKIGPEPNILSVGTWKYIEKENMLATTLEQPGDSWKIYDVSTSSWTGQYLGGENLLTFSYKKCEAEPIPDINDEWSPSSIIYRKICLNISNSSADKNLPDQMRLLFTYTHDARCFTTKGSYDDGKYGGYSYSFTYFKTSANTAKLKLSLAYIIPEKYYELDLQFTSNTSFTFSGTCTLGKKDSKILPIKGDGGYMEDIYI